MVSVKKIFALSILTLFLLVASVNSMPDAETESKELTNSGAQKVAINYVDEDILDIINDLSEKKKVNVIVPTGANALKVKVNFKLSYKETIEKAWDLLETFLDMAGYSLLPKGDMFIIVKNSKDVFDSKHSRQPTRLFIDVKPSELPTTDERITYMYYFSNLKVGEAGNDRIADVAKEVLPEQSFYKVEKATNSILVTAKAFDIKTFMELVVQLDQTEYVENLEFIRLRYTTAKVVAEMFDKILKINAPKTSLARYRADRQKPSEDSYFPESIKIIAYEQHNSLVVMGRSQAINRVKDFVYKYIDVELESGKSVLHVYNLQYLDAPTFAATLDRIVKSAATGGSGQSVGSQKKGATERFFENPIIIADKPKVQPSDNTQYAGSNKLIIAARSDDWKRIRELIEKLDRPQPQVIIEVLIADLTLNDTKQLANQIRNPAGIPFPESVTAQAAHLVSPIIDQNFTSESEKIKHTNATSLATDLIEQGIENFKQGGGGAVTPGDLNGALDTNVGASILQMADDDGKTWDILKILNTFSYAKVLSHPHIVVTNNKQAVIKSGQTRLIDGPADPGSSGIKLSRDEVHADLEVKITPRISSSQEVVLSIDIFIDDFVSADVTTGASSGDRNTRQLKTSAYLKSGNVLALGGLVKTNLSDGSTNTPILSKIPILGWLFKARKDVEDQTTLSVFITPTIIHPKLRTGIDEYTRVYTDLAKEYSEEEDLFHGLKDPITRWFFNRDIEAKEEVDAFLIHQRPREINPDKPVQIDIDQNESMVDTTQKDLATIDDRASQLKQLFAGNEKQESQESAIAIPHAQVAMPEEKLPEEQKPAQQIDHTKEVSCDNQILSRAEMLKSLLNDEESPVHSKQ